MYRTQSKFILLFVLLTSPFCSFAQTVSQDTLLSQMYRKLYAMNTDGQYAEVITEGSTFLANLKIQDSVLLSYGNVLFVVGTGHYNYGTGEQAFALTERALAIFTRLKHPRMADAYDRLGECHYWYTQDFDKAIENCQKSIAIHAQQPQENTSGKSIAYANLGMIYTAKLNYGAASASYQKALASTKNAYDLGKVNATIGQYYLSQSLYSQSLTYYTKSRTYFEKFYGDNKNHPNIATGYANEAICHEYMGAYAKAILYFGKAKEIFDVRLGPNDPNTLRIRAYMGFCYTSSAQYDNALKIFNALSENYLDQDKGLKANVFDRIMYCYAKTNQWAAFDTTLPKLIRFAETAEFANLADKITVYRNIGINYRLAKNYEQSTIYYQKALKLTDSLEVKDEKMMNLMLMDLGYDAQSDRKTDASIRYFEKVLQNRSDTNNLKSLEYYYTIFGLSLAYYQKFEIEGDKTYLNKAIDLMETSVNIILALRNDYIEEADKQYLNDDGNAVFAQLIKMLLRKNALEPDANTVKKCFILSEQNKSMRLLAAVKGLDIGRASPLVDSIKAVKQTINKIENQIVAARKDSAKTNLTYWQSELFEVSLVHQRLVNTLRTTAEADFKNLYQPDILSVEAVQKGLNADQTLLEYFVGDSSIFIFVINKDKATVTEVKKDFPLEQWIQEMRTGICTPFLASKSPNLVELTNRYVDVALKLYDKLVAPLQKGQNILRGSVIIVPDAVMGNLPFDALLVEKPTNIARPQTFNYLLNNHKISYCYSATLLNEMVNKRHRQMPSKLFLGVAPLFSKVDKANSIHKSKFEPIDNALEVNKLQHIMGGDTLIGREATKAAFIEKAKNYRILHLSTHGKMDDKIGDYSYLAFAKITDTTEHELLYTRELYNIELNADMVVLSACETGIGELQRGEGIISLARAFAFAGSKSIVTTLWKVNDTATKDVMLLFYQHLKYGKSKDDALWMAKRAYIKNYKTETALPYFWSGIILIGDSGKF